MSTMDQIAAKTTAVFDEFCDVLRTYQAEAVIATAGAVWMGLALQNPGPHGVHMPAVFAAVQTTAATVGDIWDAAKAANCGEQIKQLGEFAAKGYLSPIFTTDAGVRMLAAAPGDSLLEVRAIVADGCQAVGELLDRLERGTTAGAEVVANDDDSPSP